MEWLQWLRWCFGVPGARACSDLLDVKYLYNKHAHDGFSNNLLLCVAGPWYSTSACQGVHYAPCYTKTIHMVSWWLLSITAWWWWWWRLLAFRHVAIVGRMYWYSSTWAQHRCCTVAVHDRRPYELILILSSSWRLRKERAVSCAAIQHPLDQLSVSKIASTVEHVNCNSTSHRHCTGVEKPRCLICFTTWPQQVVPVVKPYHVCT